MAFCTGNLFGETNFTVPPVVESIEPNPEISDATNIVQFLPLLRYESVRTKLIKHLQAPFPIKIIYRFVQDEFDTFYVDFYTFDNDNILKLSYCGWGSGAHPTMNTIGDIREYMDGEKCKKYAELYYTLCEYPGSFDIYTKGNKTDLLYYFTNLIDSDSRCYEALEMPVFYPVVLRGKCL